RGRGPLEQVPSRLDGVEASDLQGFLDRLALPRAGRGSADLKPGLAPAGQLIEQRPISQDAALERRRVDLVEAQVWPEQGLALGELAAPVRGGEVRGLS